MTTNKIFLMIILLFILKAEIISQPYAYYTVAYKTNDSVATSEMRWYLHQYDFKTHQSKLVVNSVNFLDFTWDNTGNWFIMKNNRADTWISNFNENKNYNAGWDIIQFGSLLFSKINDKLYIFSSYGIEDTCMLSSITLSNSKFEELLPLSSINSKNNFNNREAFLSSDEKTIYFAHELDVFSRDNPANYHIKYFSTQTNTVIRDRPLSTIGFPNALYYMCHKGKKGIGIIESGYRSATNKWNTNFRVYNFDKDSGYAFIERIEWSEPFISSNGKYLVLSRIYNDEKVQSTFNKGTFDIFDAKTGRLLKTANYPPDGYVYFYDDYPNQLFYFIPGSAQPSAYTIDVDSLVQEQRGAKVKLINSSGNKLIGGTLQYYENGWKDAVNNNDGTFTVPTALKNISLKMNYAYSSQQKSYVTVGTDTIVFQTVNAQVKLLDSKEAILDTGRVQYYSNGWRDFGTTANGTVSKELLPGTYTFKMNYAFASIDKQQNIETNPVVEFRTKAVSVKLNNSLGNPLDVGTVQYYSNGWRNFGVTANGTAVKELLPVNYTFKMNYGFASIDKQQNVSTNPIVEFSTALVNVKLSNSLGEPLDIGTVQYYSNGWRDFGITTNGVAVKELLPVNYTFKMNYGFASIDKQQNVSTNPLVEFSTALVNVKLNNSLGEPLDVGTVQYYSNGWREFGTTTNGTAVKELLPVNYTFKMNYGFASIDKQQNVSTNPVVLFQTTKAHVELRNSLSQLMLAPMGDVGTVQYYSNGWRDFGTTTNGIAEKELLPVNYTFKMNYSFASIDKQQNLSQNGNVVFQTVNALVQLKDSQGNSLDGGTVEYYSNGWRNFGTTENGNVQKELLPASYTFKMTHAFVSNDKVQVIGTNNTITFSTTLCSINVMDAQNQPVNNASVSYYSNGWRIIGATVNGLITKELLPANLTFRAVSGSKQMDKTQNTAINNNVEIKLP